MSESLATLDAQRAASLRNVAGAVLLEAERYLGSKVDVGELVVSVLALSLTDDTPKSRQAATAILDQLVRLVGKRRVLAIVDHVCALGAHGTEPDDR